MQQFSMMELCICNSWFTSMCHNFDFDIDRYFEHCIFQATIDNIVSIIYDYIFGILVIECSHPFHRKDMLTMCHTLCLALQALFRLRDRQRPLHNRYINHDQELSHSFVGQVLCCNEVVMPDYIGKTA